MLGKIRNLLIASGAATLVVLSFLGTISATLSWFSYSAKVSLSYHGTSISSNKQLQIGIVTDIDMTSYGLECDEGIAWSLPGAGLSQSQISGYLTETGHATDILKPVTSRTYSIGDEFCLYEEPYDYDPDNESIASSDKYVDLPVAFRVINVVDGSYAKNKDIWITDSEVKGQGFEGFNIKDGVRVFFSGETNDFILNAAQTDPGSTIVSGLLDLNDDGYYDTNSSGKEIIYGTYGGTPTYDDPTGEDSELDDIYGTGKDFPYIFLSKHKGTSYCVNNLDELDIGYADYETLQSVAPTSDSYGNYCDGLPVANTGDEGIGKTRMIIYVEGWDQAVVNQVAALRFELGLTFEINKQ